MKIIAKTDVLAASFPADFEVTVFSVTDTGESVKLKIEGSGYEVSSGAGSVYITADADADLSITVDDEGEYQVDAGGGLVVKRKQLALNRAYVLDYQVEWSDCAFLKLATVNASTQNVQILSYWQTNLIAAAFGIGSAITGIANAKVDLDDNTISKVAQASANAAGRMNYIP